MQKDNIAVELASLNVVMSGNFILEFPSMNSPILTLTHAWQAHIGKIVVCSLCCSHEPNINIHDVCGLG